MATKSSSSSLTVLLLGATGEVGRQVLLSALSSPSISSVQTLGRSAPSSPTTTPGYSKLVSTGVDFEKLLEGDKEEVQKFRLGGRGADVVLVTLGTTKANAGSMEKFVRIDREYVLEGAKAAFVVGKDQKLIYCSSGGASSSSLFPYLKSKGLTEEGLAAIGYKETIIFKPGFLSVPGGRGEHRLVESVLGKFMGLAANLSNSVQITTPVLGSAIVRAALEDAKDLGKLARLESMKGRDAWVVGNPEAMELGQ